jgi:hypothetical protein
MLNKQKLEEALNLLNNRLELAKASPVHIIACGGSALIITGIVGRTTKDIDVLGIMKTFEGKKEILKPEPLPEVLQKSILEVADTLGIDKNWLNTGPKDLLKYGLPEGFLERLEKREYGRLLTVYFAGRIDQIYFKVYAAVDSGPGRHVDDLLLLQPTVDEIEKAAKWAMTHDPSEPFRNTLKEMLRVLKYESVAERI